MKTLLFINICLVFNTFAQKPDSVEVEKPWTFTVGVGLNFSFTAISNPTPAAGNPGFMTTNSVDLEADYQKEKSLFQMTNEAHWLFSLSKTDINLPTQKVSDELNTLHDFSRSFSKKSKWNINIIAKATTGIFSIYDGDYLRDVNNKGQIFGFANPYDITLSPGIKFEPNKAFRLSISPYSLRFYGVTDQKIADTGLYTDLELQNNGHYTTTKTEKLGAEVNFWFDKKVKNWLIMQYRLGISSNYFEKLLQNGKANGFFITKIKLIKNVFLTHRATLKADFAQNPFKPFISQTLLLEYKVSF